jgi:hypothetical protein
MSKKKEDFVTVREEVPVTLTQAEIVEKAEELSRSLSNYDAIDEERKAVANDYKEKLKELDGKIEQLAQMIREKREFREMECHALAKKDGTLEIFHPETGERIHARMMTEEERQLEL